MGQKFQVSLLCVATVHMLVARPAFADDKAAQNIHDWSGAYVGLSANHLFGEATDDFQGFLFGAPWLSYVDHISLKGNGVGAFAGYNFQDGNFVYGIEADIGHSPVKGRLDFPGDATKGAYVTNVAIGWNGHMRGRIGYACDNVLLFAAGGLALAQLDYRYNWPPDPRDVYHSRALSPGLSIGGGAEFALTDSLTLRTEYIYDRFSAHRFDFQGTGALSFYRAIDDVDFATHRFQIGVAYAF